MNRDEPPVWARLLGGACAVLCLVLTALVPVAALLALCRLIAWLASGLF